ncbi:2-dehydropantoate 2-reductase [Thozetella sp. PMI_491]|nr:2-dehydropantoate 2-reductase [Thozetella sp. PMI_491]
MSEKSQIDVMLYGLGAIGSFYAFILSRSERVRLTVVARSNYEAVKANGLLVRSENHGNHLVRPYKVVKSPTEAGATYDFIVCANKAIDQPSLPDNLAPAVDETKSTVVLIQNGVGIEEPIRERWPGVTIITCVTWVGARQNEPGIVHHTKWENTQMGLFSNSVNDSSLEQSRLESFCDLLRVGGTPFSVEPNIQVERWEKVVWNAAWNSLTALTGLDSHSWLAMSPETEPLTRRLMGEVVAVAQACGVPVTDDVVDRLLEKTMSVHTFGSSTFADYKAGRPMEIDVFLGYPYRKGRELGLPIPLLEFTYMVLVANNNRFMGIIESKIW